MDRISHILCKYTYKLAVNSAVLYHGTPIKENYQRILKKGLLPNQASIYLEESSPLEGGIYLTKDFGNAVRYSFISQTDDYEKDRKKEPNGYVFEFSNLDKLNMTPDEDELGAWAASVINKKLPDSLRSAFEDMPDELYQKIKKPDPSFSVMAQVGKWLIKRFSKRVLNNIRKSKDFFNVVVYEPIKPTAVWVIPKAKEQFLRDNNNSFNTTQGWGDYGKKYGKRKSIG